MRLLAARVLAAAALLAVPALAQVGPSTRPPRGGGPKPGEAAPDFTLERLDGSGKVRLSDFKGVRPVFLVFGSYT